MMEIEKSRFDLRLYVQKKKEDLTSLGTLLFLNLVSEILFAGATLQLWRHKLHMYVCVSL